MKDKRINTGTTSPNSADSQQSLSVFSEGTSQSAKSLAPLLAEEYFFQTSHG